VNDNGVKASYSETGANLWVCAPSGDSNRPGITTTDISGSTFGYNAEYYDDDLEDPNYTKYFSGTSASTPIVSGVVALMLEANPTLSYRDVKIILAKTARQNDSESMKWEMNRAGYMFNQDYGFGVVDAKAAVETAKSGWSNVGAELTHTESESSLDIAITHGTQISSNIVVTGSGITFIEYIQVTLDITHGDWGDLNISLKRDGSNLTYLSENHYCYQDDYITVTPCNTISSTYTFGVSKFIGESADNTWTLDLQDVQQGFEGTLNGWEIKFYGH
jgi:subtilisin-like proprotein convertase family protein